MHGLRKGHRRKHFHTSHSYNFYCFFYLVFSINYCDLPVQHVQNFAPQGEKVVAPHQIEILRLLADGEEGSAASQPPIGEGAWGNDQNRDLSLFRHGTCVSGEKSMVLQGGLPVGDENADAPPVQDLPQGSGHVVKAEKGEDGGKDYGDKEDQDGQGGDNGDGDHGRRGQHDGDDGLHSAEPLEVKAKLGEDQHEGGFTEGVQQVAEEGAFPIVTGIAIGIVQQAVLLGAVLGPSGQTAKGKIDLRAVVVLQLLLEGGDLSFQLGRMAALRGQLTAETGDFPILLATGLGIFVA